MEIFLVSALVMVGLLLLLAEFIFIPGTTIAGWLGLLFSLVGIFFAYHYFDAQTGTLVLMATVLSSVGMGYYGLRSGTWRRFALHDTVFGKATLLEEHLRVGQEGRTISALRPSGRAVFDQTTCEVRTEGTFLESNTPVRITQINGQKIYVTSTLTSL
ncbi:MAG: NfeD family protein [Bernardetiaceae bacterium]